MPFLPWYLARDYAWGIRDHLWEWDIVERIRQGCAAPQALSTYDSVASSYPYHEGGWEKAEEHSKNANRLHSAYLDDASIAKRAAKRDLLKQQMEETRAAWKAYDEGKGPRPQDTDDMDPFRAHQRKERERVAAAAKAERDKTAAANRAMWEAESARRREEKAVRDEQRRKEAEDIANQLHRMRALVPMSAEQLKRAEEEKRLMESKWLCTICNGRSIIGREPPGYRITCLSCGKSAWGSHAALWGVLSK